MKELYIGGIKIKGLLIDLIMNWIEFVDMYGVGKDYYGKLLNYMTVVEVLAKGIILTQKRCPSKISPF